MFVLPKGKYKKTGDGNYKKKVLCTAMAVTILLPQTDKFIVLANIKELTPEVLLTFVSKIVIHERSEKRSKSATQQIDIYFTHIGNAGQI